MSKTRTLNVVTYLLAGVVILIVWVPSTRIFLSDVAFGTLATAFISLILCLSSLAVYRKNHSKLNLIPLIISLSPIIFILLIILFATLGYPLAP